MCAACGGRRLPPPRAPGATCIVRRAAGLRTLNSPSSPKILPGRSNRRSAPPPEDGLRAPVPRRRSLLPSPAMEIMGIQIRTIVQDNVATRCDGCHEIIEGTPWRINLLDIVAAEAPVAWTERPAINPGPFQFHSDPACVRRWMAARATSSAGAARSARSCGRSRFPVSRRAGACATGSTATTTSSSRPDPRGRRLTALRAEPILRLPGRIGVPRFTQVLRACHPRRVAEAPMPDARQRRSATFRRRRPPRAGPGCRSGRPAACSASTPTRSAAGRTRAGSRPSRRPGGHRRFDRRALERLAANGRRRAAPAGQHGCQPGAAGARLSPQLHERRRRPGESRPTMASIANATARTAAGWSRP